MPLITLAMKQSKSRLNFTVITFEFQPNRIAKVSTRANKDIFIIVIWKGPSTFESVIFQEHNAVHIGKPVA